jgi:hypothetical protein
MEAENFEATFSSQRKGGACGSQLPGDQKKQNLSMKMVITHSLIA